MSIVLTCTHGHEWTLPDDPFALENSHFVCPVCGVAVDVQAPTLPAEEEMPPVGLSHFPSLPGYEIRSQLGRGGMGVVYRAYDLKGQKEVALKTMQWVEPAALYRFKQEFRALAGLAHPNLVTLYELISDGRDWFFTMELIDGVSFLSYVRGEKPPDKRSREENTDSSSAPTISPLPNLERLRDALGQLVSGIAVLHDAGKLHRDIKPANVLVTRQGRVVLLDFGLTAELDRSGQHQSTQPHLLGTVAYMAPEQAASQPVSAASDWYAVGVMLYEALTGQLPFDGPTLEVLQKKQKEDPLSPRSLLPQIPADLDMIAVDLLHRQPQQRPSGRDILRRLSTRKEDAESTALDVSFRLPSSALSGPLIGRERHLQALNDAFLAAKQGRTVVLHVHGLSGLGKSTLVRHFLDGLGERQEAVVLAGKCYEQEAVPYKALDSLVDALSRYLVRLSALEVEALLPRDVLALARVFPVLRRVEAVAQAPRRPLNLSDAQEVRRRALVALRELLGRLGDRRPLVLFIDDLQWGDADSAALLADLLRPPDAPALLLVVSYRSQDVNVSPCLKVLLGPAEPRQDLDLRQLVVEPLTQEEGRDLVLTFLDATNPSARIQAEAIARESGGNPFFLCELVQHTAAVLTSAQTSKEGGVALAEVLWRRIVHLPTEARRLLEVIAVAGRPLRQIEAGQAAQLDSAALAALALLRAGRLVRSVGAQEDHAIETYHDRIRETVVAHLEPVARQEYHRRLALALEQAGQSDPELLAIHFQGANDLSQAGKYYALAASQATEALAFDRAAKLYRLALPLHLAAGAEERSLRTRLGDALANAGRGAESAREYLAAAAGATAAESLELQRRAALQLLISGHVDEGLATLRAVLSAVGMAMPKTPRRAFWSFLWRRVQLRWRGLGFRLRPAGEVARADLSRIDICWSAAAGLSMVDTIQGAYFHTRGLLLALTAGEPSHLVRALAMEAAHVSIGGSHTQQRTTRLLQTAETLAQQVDHPYPAGMVALAKGIAAAFAGNWRQGCDLCDQAAASLRGSCTGVVWELDTAHRFALWALMFMGEIPEMARRLPVLLKEAQERDDLYAVLNLTLVVGTFVRLAADEPERARSEMNEVMARWSRQGFHVQHLNYLSDEAQIELYRGESRTAWEYLTAGWPKLAGSHFLRVQQVRIFMWHLRARCALAASTTSADPKPILRAAERDARLLQKERIPWSEALSGLVRAGVALMRRETGATELLREAAAKCAAVDMPLYAAAARRLLGQLIGGNEGRTLVEQADGWMGECRIQDPARLAAMLVPGLPV